MIVWSRSCFCPPAKRRSAQSHQPIPRRLCRRVRALGRRSALRKRQRRAQGARHGTLAAALLRRLDTLFDYLPRSLVMLGHQVEEAKAARLELISDCYDTREQFRHQDPDAKTFKAAPYKPLKPETLYLKDGEWKDALAHHLVRDLTPFQAPESKTSVDAGGRQGRDFAPERAGRQSQRVPGGCRSSSGAAGRRQARGGGELDAMARPNAWAACCRITASPRSAVSRIGPRR